MALWSKGLHKNRLESKSAEQSSSGTEEQVATQSARKEIDWEERHFQICLVLLSRTEIGLRGCTSDPQMPMIIRRADKMVELLKIHRSELQDNKDKE